MVWGLCIGKAGGVKSCLGGLSGGIVGQGHSVPLTRPVSAPSIYAAIVYVLRARFSLPYLVKFSCLIWCLILPSLSLSPPLPEDLSP